MYYILSSIVNVDDDMFAKGLEHVVVVVVVVVVKLEILCLYRSLGKLKFCNEWMFSGVFEYWVPTLHVKELLLQKLLFCDSLQNIHYCKEFLGKKNSLSLSLTHTHILENLTFVRISHSSWEFFTLSLTFLRTSHLWVSHILVQKFSSLSHILENLTFVRISHSSWEFFTLSLSHSL